MKAIKQTDIAIVGAGIVGLAHALAAAKRRLKVVVFERNSYAVGASIRNFGMIWPIGQPVGHLRDRALKSREIWTAIASQANFHLDPSGSLHLAYREDEMAVLEEFTEAMEKARGAIQLLTPTEVMRKSPAVVPEGLLGGLWSPTEMIVDPREAIRKIPSFLAKTYGVEFRFGTVITNINYPHFVAAGEKWTAKEQIFVCSGSDFETLYPSHYADSKITKVKLQMMRTVPQSDFRIQTALCAGLTLTHYAAFEGCPSLAALKARIANETPYFPRWGIHVMVSQNAAGELIIGDSHEYGLNPEPFDKENINRYIIEYLQTFARVPTLEIAETWHGVYAKLPGKTELIFHPEEGVTVVNALSGAGMTLSFGLAEETVARTLTYHLSQPIA